MTFKHI